MKGSRATLRFCGLGSAALALALAGAACRSSPPPAAAPAPASAASGGAAAPVPGTAEADISGLAQREIIRRQERLRQMDEAALEANRALSESDLEGAVQGFREAAAVR